MDQIELARVLASLANAGDVRLQKETITSVDRGLGGTFSDYGYANSDWFMRELRKILNTPTNHAILSWLPEGKIWRIHDIAAFRIIVIPQLPVIREFPNSFDLFMAYTRVKGFQEMSRGHNSVAFYNEMFFRELPESPAAPLKEIYLPPVPMLPTNTANQALKTDRKKNNVPCMPLPPPPFTLLNQKKPPPLPVTIVDENKCARNNHSYYVDSVRGMNLVKLLRAREVADKTLQNPAAKSIALTSKPMKPQEVSHYLPKRKAKKASCGGKKAKKIRKKWLPSLGPPESESIRILTNTAIKGAWYCERC